MISFYNPIQTSFLEWVLIWLRAKEILGPCEILLFCLFLLCTVAAEHGKLKSTVLRGPLLLLRSINMQIFLLKSFFSLFTGKATGAKEKIILGWRKQILWHKDEAKHKRKSKRIYIGSGNFKYLNFVLSLRFFSLHSSVLQGCTEEMK